jgi:hypothetical protein
MWGWDPDDPSSWPKHDDGTTYEPHENNLNETRAWAEGDVWFRYVEKRVTWHTDDEDFEDRDEWEEVPDSALHGCLRAGVGRGGCPGGARLLRAQGGAGMIPVTITSSTGTNTYCTECRQDMPAYWTRSGPDGDDKDLVLDHHDDPATGRKCRGSHQRIC